MSGDTVTVELNGALEFALRAGEVPVTSIFDPRHGGVSHARVRIELERFRRRHFRLLQRDLWRKKIQTRRPAVRLRQPSICRSEAAVFFNGLIKVAEGFLRILCTRSARKVQPPEVQVIGFGGYNSLIIWARIWIGLEALRNFISDRACAFSLKSDQVHYGTLIASTLSAAQVPFVTLGPKMLIRS